MLIAGMNELKEAIAFAKSTESKWAADMKMPDGQFVMTYDSGEKAPDNEMLGPVTPRGGHSGIVYRGGKLLAEWGDTNRADMTFSVAKSFLVAAGRPRRRRRADQEPRRQGGRYARSMTASTASRTRTSPGATC